MRMCGESLLQSPPRPQAEALGDSWALSFHFLQILWMASFASLARVDFSSAVFFFFKQGEMEP